MMGGLLVLICTGVPLDVVDIYGQNCGYYILAFFLPFESYENPLDSLGHSFWGIIYLVPCRVEVNL